MRVLQVHSGNLYGGVETMLSAMSSQYKAQCRIEMEYALCFSGRFATEIESQGCAVHNLGEVRVRDPLSVVRARSSLRRLLNSVHYDVVICQAAWTLAIFGATVKRAGLPLVFWLHDPPTASLHWLEKWAKRNRPELVLCNSKYTQNLGRRLFADAPSHVVYCPVRPPARQIEESERRRVRSEFGADSATCVILQVGRLERHKGHLIHLDALAQLPKTSSWMFWCVGGVQKPGENAYLDEIRRKISEKGLADRVRLIGWQPSLQDIYASADLYCQPNVRPEPFGIAFVEAMYAGLPVIGTAHGGTVEVISPAVGLLVPPGEPESLSAALSNLLNDRTRRLSLGANGPARARFLCDPANQAKTLETMLMPLLTSRAA